MLHGTQSQANSFTEYVRSSSPSAAILLPLARIYHSNRMFLSPHSAQTTFCADALYWSHYQGQPHFTNRQEIINSGISAQQVMGYIQNNEPEFLDNKPKSVAVLLDFAPLAQNSLQAFNQEFSKLLSTIVSAIPKDQLKHDFERRDYEKLLAAKGMWRLRNALRLLKSIYGERITVIIDHVDRPFLTLPQEARSALNDELTPLCKNHEEVSTLTLFGVHDMRYAGSFSSPYNAFTVYSHHEVHGLPFAPHADYCPNIPHSEHQLAQLFLTRQDNQDLLSTLLLGKPITKEHYSNGFNVAAFVARESYYHEWKVDFILWLSQLGLITPLERQGDERETRYEASEPAQIAVLEQLRSRYCLQAPQKCLTFQKDLSEKEKSALESSPPSSPRLKHV